MKADIVYCGKLYDDGLIDWLNIFIFSFLTSTLQMLNHMQKLSRQNKNVNTKH